MGPLRADGLVASRPGVKGGSELAADPSTITLGRVWRLLQGVDPVLGLHGPNPSCSVGRGAQSSLVALNERVGDAVTAELEQVTVMDMFSRVDQQDVPFRS